MSEDHSCVIDIRQGYPEKDFNVDWAVRMAREACCKVFWLGLRDVLIDSAVFYLPRSRTPCVGIFELSMGGG